jgi:phosphatidylglycerophosphate synthase
MFSFWLKGTINKFNLHTDIKNVKSFSSFISAIKMMNFQNYLSLTSSFFVFFFYFFLFLKYCDNYGGKIGDSPIFFLWQDSSNCAKREKESVLWYLTRQYKV